MKHFGVMVFLLSVGLSFSQYSFSDELSSGENENSAETTTGSSRARNEYRAPLATPDFHESCQGFIAADGSLGPWGREFVQAMHAVEAGSENKDIFFGKGSDMIKIGEACKGTEHFESLTQSQQEHIWTWAWAAIAQEDVTHMRRKDQEHKCIPDRQEQGIWNSRTSRHDISDGLVGMEYSTQTRRANGRDRRFCPNNANTQEINFQARCAASIMATFQSGRLLVGERRRSYWHVLRGQGRGPVGALIKKHPLCQ